MLRAAVRLFCEDVRRLWKSVLLALSVWAVLSLLAGTPCTLRLLCGIPCPCCGMTRAAFLLLCGNFAASFAMQPFLIPTVLTFVPWLAGRYVHKRWWTVAAVYTAMLAAALLAWYAFNMLTVFPAAEPYTYRSQNLLHFLLSM